MNILFQITSHILMGSVCDESSAPGGGSAPDDTELVRRAQSGDYAAFDVLVTRHRGNVYAMIVNMVHNSADAWDLSQDAFVKAWKALPKFENRARFSTWLFRVTHNVVYDWMRKKKVQGDGEFDDAMFSEGRIDMAASTAPKSQLQPDEAMHREEKRVELENAIAELSSEHREIILLREVQGLEYAEIAEVVGCSNGTVMSRLFYARKKLQTILRP